ncbi:MAG: transcription elongation factor GreA [Eubacteriales bacterium]|nr:transcription elongation factor GreA [Eubacteriales bacterium]
MKHRLTQNDINKMKEEIEHRKVVVRKELLEHVKEARAHGDLSENFEYHAAKKEKNKNESRIRYLERMIRSSEVVEEKREEGVVGINTSVELFFLDEGETDTFSIVTTVLVDTMKNRVSIESPIGKALMGHRVGDQVHVDVNPNFGYDVLIRSVSPFSDENLQINEY